MLQDKIILQRHSVLLDSFLHLRARIVAERRDYDLRIFIALNYCSGVRRLSPRWERLSRLGMRYEENVRASGCPYEGGLLCLSSKERTSINLQDGGNRESVRQCQIAMLSIRYSVHCGRMSSKGEVHEVQNTCPKRFFYHKPVLKSLTSCLSGTGCS